MLESIYSFVSLVHHIVYLLIAGSSNCLFHIQNTMFEHFQIQRIEWTQIKLISSIIWLYSIILVWLTKDTNCTNSSLIPDPFNAGIFNGKIPMFSSNRTRERSYNASLRIGLTRSDIMVDLPYALIHFFWTIHVVGMHYTMIIPFIFPFIWWIERVSRIKASEKKSVVWYVNLARKVRQAGTNWLEFKYMYFHIRRFFQSSLIRFNETNFYCYRLANKPHVQNHRPCMETFLM